MIDALRQYLSDEGVPRWRKIVLTPESFISLAVGLTFVLFGDALFSAFPKVGDLTTGLIAYMSIALGFCVAGLTISLTLPDQDFAVTLATKQPEEKTSAYSDLLFVFSWTAVVHWSALVMLFAVVLFVDSGAVLLPKGHYPLRTWVVAVIAAVCVYCLCQFLITLITISQVGSVYIGHLAKKHPTK
jgi:hypothetical protein